MLRVPTVVSRRSTDHPEAFGSFTELLVPGRAAAKALTAAWDRHEGWRQRLRERPFPFGDGTGGQRIVEQLERWQA